MVPDDGGKVGDVRSGYGARAVGADPDRAVVIAEHCCRVEVPAAGVGCVVVPENPSAVAYAVNRTGLIVVTQNPDEIHSATGAGAIAATERKGPCDHADDIAYIVITENPSPVTKSINHTDLIA
ncbi:hypothetical protein, partial [Mycobacterium persicum]|uniref:hypothetical protein n=1 Tax=Mycobacterium persicum TaxID=1487726 RepID=UPI001C3C8A8E